MTVIFRNGQRVELEMDEFYTVLHEVAKKAAEISRDETMSRKAAIQRLTSRAELEKFIRRKIINPMQEVKGGKMSLLRSEVETAYKIQQQELKLKNKK